MTLYPHPGAWTLGSSVLHDLLAKRPRVCVCAHTRSVMYDSAALWTAAHQAPLSMEFPRQESWSGLSFPSPGDLPGPGIKPTSPALAGGFFTSSATSKAQY